MTSFSTIAHAVIPHVEYVKLSEEQRIEIAKKYYYKFTKSNTKRK